MTECQVVTFQYSPLMCAKQSVDRLSVIKNALVALFLNSRSNYLSDIVGYFLGRRVSPLTQGFLAVSLKLSVMKPWARVIYFK